MRRKFCLFSPKIGNFFSKWEFLLKFADFNKFEFQQVWVKKSHFEKNTKFSKNLSLLKFAESQQRVKISHFEKKSSIFGEKDQIFSGFLPVYTWMFFKACKQYTDRRFPQKKCSGECLCIIGVKIRSKHILLGFELGEIVTVHYQCQKMYITIIKPNFYELIDA